MRTSREWILAVTGACLTVVSATMVACSGSGSANDGRDKYANDADTGAAAPATQQTLSPNPEMGKANPGVERGTGVGNMAGDTAGAYGKAAGATGAVPGQPTSGSDTTRKTNSRTAPGAPRP